MNPSLAGVLWLKLEGYLPIALHVFVDVALGYVYSVFGSSFLAAAAAAFWALAFLAECQSSFCIGRPTFCSVASPSKTTIWRDSLTQQCLYTAVGVMWSPCDRSVMMSPETIEIKKAGPRGQKRRCAWIYDELKSDVQINRHGSEPVFYYNDEKPLQDNQKKLFFRMNSWNICGISECDQPPFGVTNRRERLL